MYADRVTESMQVAIDETNRRREIQETYNTEHGIEPRRSSRRSTTSTCGCTAWPEHHRLQLRARRRPERSGPRRVEKVVARMEAEMKAAAKELEFQRAGRAARRGPAEPPAGPRTGCLGILGGPPSAPRRFPAAAGPPPPNEPAAGTRPGACHATCHGGHERGLRRRARLRPVPASLDGAARRRPGYRCRTAPGNPLMRMRYQAGAGRQAGSSGSTTDAASTVTPNVIRRSSTLFAATRTPACAANVLSASRS